MPQNCAAPHALLLSLPRCLQDNDWDYGQAGQVFTQLKVRFFHHFFTFFPLFHPIFWGPLVDPSPPLSFQLEGKIPEVAFLK